MRIQKVIQKALDERTKKEEEREFLSKKETDLKALLRNAGLKKIIFRKGWWVFGDYYKIELLDDERIYYEKNSPARGWQAFHKQHEQAELLTYLFT